MFPREVLKAVWVALASVLIPSTWVPLSSNAEYSWRNEETWFVHPPVKSKTWNDSTTFFWPRYWLKLTSSPKLEGILKSGAVCPISAAIILTSTA